MSVLAVDIGGANIKAAHAAGGAWSRPFALWKQPEKLVDELAAMMRQIPAFDTLLLTMTAELCDCFETKRVGVNHVLDAARQLAGTRDVRVWTTRGNFVDLEQARADPMRSAASNWHALTTFVAHAYPHGRSLLIDTGSTTTDILRLRDGRVDAIGLTDFHRLASGELIYSGAKRTALMALGPTINFRGASVNVMAEYFATTHDVYVLTGDLREQPDTRDTADGRAMTRDHAAARVLRMIGGDVEMFSIDDAVAIAHAFADQQVQRIAESVQHVLQHSPRGGGEEVSRVIVSGSGDFIAARAAGMVAANVPLIRLADQLGPDASVAACAYALLQLWRRS